MIATDKKTIDLKELTELVEQRLSAYCAKKILEAKKIDPKYELLWGELKDYLEAGGKRIRPKICIELYIGYGGEDINQIVDVAAAWEIMHSSLLIIDDIIDRDTLRHGRKNMSGVYEDYYSNLKKEEAKHFAMSAALLGGDLFLIAPYEIISKSNLDPTDKIKMIELFSRAFFETAGGEHIDVVSVLVPVEEVNVESIIKNKTSGYSFSLPMISGAILAGADQSELSKLEDLGNILGYIFQVGDDLLGFFGDIEQTGKPNDSDIREKKRTLIIKKAIERLSKKEAEKINQYYHVDHELNQNNIDKIYSLIADTNIKEEILIELDSHCKQAEKLIDSLHASDQAKDFLTNLTSKLKNRSS